MTERSTGYSVTADATGTHDERFTATYHLAAETVRRVEDWADAAGVTPSAVIDAAVRHFAGQLGLLVRRDEAGDVDEYGRAWLSGWFRA